MVSIADDISLAGKAFMAFVMSPDRVAQASTDKIEALIRHLDWLAMAMHDTEPDSFDPAEYPEPALPKFETIYQAVQSGFSELRPYTFIILDAQSGVSKKPWEQDPWDDLTDIYRDLFDGIWRMEHTSRSDGLFELSLSYRSHWCAHLRALQAYLQTLTVA
ncbi:hypothetical protein Astex_0462 [Asticcacaulis excentricus CB 48]|uniref:DUF5063 domain-containing protein n=2 Tax=Asticcacaulis excentricus TaxID=78587 RepID=E8RQH3_ASTEC|nr:hypothetical protein Astex_0462 [Asticcacaulis excentricus CB 48]